MGPHPHSHCIPSLPSHDFMEVARMSAEGAWGWQGRRRNRGGRDLGPLRTVDPPQDEALFERTKTRLARGPEGCTGEGGQRADGSLVAGWEMLERYGVCYERTGEEGLKGGLEVGMNIHMSEITIKGQKGDHCFLGKPIPGPRRDTARSRRGGLLPL